MQVLLRHLQSLVNLTGVEFDYVVCDHVKSSPLPKRHGGVRHIVVTDIPDGVGAESLAEQLCANSPEGAHGVCDGDTMWLIAPPTRAIKYEAPNGVNAKWSIRVYVGAVGAASTMLLTALLHWTQTADSMISRVMIYTGDGYGHMTKWDEIMYRVVGLYIMHQYCYTEVPAPLSKMGPLAGPGRSDGKLDTGFRVYKLVDAEPEIYAKSPLEQRLSAKSERRASA